MDVRIGSGLRTEIETVTDRERDRERQRERERERERDTETETDRDRERGKCLHSFKPFVSVMFTNYSVIYFPSVYCLFHLLWQCKHMFPMPTTPFELKLKI